MSVSRCRVCSHEFFAEPLLKLKNMPTSAQFLPDADSLKDDRGIVLEVCQCPACGLVQLNNEPVPYYREVIRAAAFSEEMRDFRKKQFDDFIRKFSLKKKKIIEVGCGRGEFLSIMRQLGAEAYGLEYSQESVEQCIRNGLRVSKGFVGAGADTIKDAPFDAFFSSNFLEHLPDPNSTLRGIYRNLADDAVGLIEAPNFDMILRKKLFSEFISDHLLYFTKETLSSTLTRNAFEVIECDEVWHDYIISAVVRKGSSTLPQKGSAPLAARKRLDMSHFCEHQAKLKEKIEEYIRRFKDKKVAVWGAGHQALTAISLLNLTGKIKYVVDSAPFKQGRFTPATHIPIVSPDTLNSDPVDAIIVMAASYSDEVAAILRQKFDRNINVAILRDFGLEIVQ